LRWRKKLTFPPDRKKGKLLWTPVPRVERRPKKKSGKKEKHLVFSYYTGSGRVYNGHFAQA